METNTIVALSRAIADLLTQTVQQTINAQMAQVAKPAAECNYPINVTIDKAVEITGYSRNSLYQMHSRGQVPGAFKRNGKLLFRTAELMAWGQNAQH